MQHVCDSQAVASGMSAHYWLQSSQFSLFLIKVPVFFFFFKFYWALFELLEAEEQGPHTANAIQ